MRFACQRCRHDCAAHNRFRKIIRRSIVGYFAPVIAACRLFGKPTWDYGRQLRVVYRYAFWKLGCCLTDVSAALAAGASKNGSAIKKWQRHSFAISKKWQCHSFARGRSEIRISSCVAKKELKLVADSQLFVDFGGARVYVIGAGLLAEDAKQRKGRFRKIIRRSIAATLRP